MLLGDAWLIEGIHTINYNAGYLYYLFHIFGKISGKQSYRRRLLEVKGKSNTAFHKQYIVNY